MKAAVLDYVRESISWQSGSFFPKLVTPMVKKRFSQLSSIASQSLSANIIDTPEGAYLAAGGHQFRSLWTRDFCFAVRGLLILGRSDVVRRHLTHLIRTRRDDGVIARILESVPSWKRVFVHTALRWIPDSFKNFAMDKPLRAEHLGEHRTISIDSNALVLRAVADLQRADPNEVWMNENRASLQQILDFCLSRSSGGTELVNQGRYEDWQDSASREGQTLYVNLLFALAFRAANELGLSVPKATTGFTNLVINSFRNEPSTLLRSHRNLDLISIDGDLLVITEKMMAKDQAQTLYRELCEHPVWKFAEIPGVASYPDYPKEWISWTTDIVGLRHYHDRFLWSWLAGLAALAAVRVGDHVEAERIFTQLEKMSVRDGAIAEVYRAVPDVPMVRTLLYVSENPFSWGAGVILEALSEYEKLENPAI